jgi:hypothetical protein
MSLIAFMLPVDGLTQAVVVATAAVRRDLTIADVAEYIDVFYIQHAVTVTWRASVQSNSKRPQSRADSAAVNPGELKATRRLP